ncbi:MAG: hypothetical protein AAF696_14250, partial [Bacteroidota bacterium]
QLNQVDEQLPHQKFTPGELAKLKARIMETKSLLNTQEQAAMAQAGERYHDLTDLREKILRLEQEFEIWYNASLETTRVLFESIQANRKVELKEYDGNAEVDYWTRGAYGELENQVKGLLDSLEKDKDSLSLEKVKEILGEAQKLADKQARLIEEAIERAVSSQIRAEMADMIIEKLAKDGYEVRNYGYEQEDQRKIYLVKLQNEAKTEVVVAIVPDEQTNTNTLSINTKDPHGENEEVTRERSRQIRKSLEEANLKLGEEICNDERINEFYDVDSIVKSNSPGIPKQVLRKAQLLNKQTE